MADLAAVDLEVEEAVAGKNIPENSGVYLFKDKDKTILYIGKAKNLKKRISSYFQKNHN